MAYSVEDVKEQLELEDIITLLDYFGAEPEQRGDYIVARTICHDGNSRKLYYYNNDGIHYNFGRGKAYNDRGLADNYYVYAVGYIDHSSIPFTHSNNYRIGNYEYCGCGKIV